MESKHSRESARKRTAVPPAVRVSRAATALAIGLCDEAAVQAHQILDQDPAQLGALEILAKSLWRIGQFDELLRVLDRMSALNPYEPGYASLRGSALQCMGRYGEATQAFLRGGMTPGSKEALAEIQAWQQELISDLLRSDVVFKTHFARAPREACACRGFSLASNSQPGAKWWPAEQDRSWMYTRPS